MIEFGLQCGNHSITGLKIKVIRLSAKRKTL